MKTNACPREEERRRFDDGNTLLITSLMSQSWFETAWTGCRVEIIR